MGADDNLEQALERLPLRRWAQAQNAGFMSQFVWRMRRANPNLTASQMEAYSAEFRIQIESLSEAVFRSQIERLSSDLKDAEQALIIELAKAPDGAELFDAINAVMRIMTTVAMEAVSKDGLSLHTKCADKAFRAT